MNESRSPSQKIRPSHWFHLLALAMIAAAALCGYKIIAVAVNSMQSGLTRAIFPGELVVPISAPGNYVIYYESPSEFDGRVFDTGSRVPGMKFSVINNETEDELPVAQPSFNETYEMNGRRGRSVLEFRVFKPGSYTVVGRYDDQTNQEAVFGVGNVHIARLALLIIGGIFSILILGGGALLIIVLIEARRSSAKRKLRAGTSIQGSVAPPPPL